MADNTILGNAPYATAPTSIIVHKGRGVLVRRARDLQGAIVDAIEEFGLKRRPEDVYISAYIGQQGQEVIVSKSAFAFIRDTIPLHIHVREEDISKPQSELARWPAPPIRPLPVNMFGPATQFTLRKPAFGSAPEASAVPPVPSALPLASERALSKAPSSEMSKMESISDWRKTATGTPDTAPSIHRHLPSQPTFIESPEQLLPIEIPDPPGDEPKQMLGSPLEVPLALEAVGTNASSASNAAAKPWNWFKKAVRGVSPSPEESQPPPALGDDQKQHAPFSNRSDSQVALADVTKDRPGAAQQQSSNSKRSSRQVARDIEEMLDDHDSSMYHDNAPAPTVDDSSWGPGGLVLDDGPHAHAEADALANSHLPWWARPPDAAFDMGTKTRNKMGLKPLKLVKPGQSSNSSASVASDVESDVVQHRHVKNARTRSKQEQAGSLTPRGVLMHMQPSPPGSAGSDDMYYREPQAQRQPKARSSPRHRRRDPSIDENRRPLPADIPQSPASSRRFTRGADQLDATDLAARHPMPNSNNSKSHKRSQHDVVPVLPAARDKHGRAPARPSRQAKASVSSINSFPTTPDSSEPEMPVAPSARRRKKSTVDIRAAVPVALPERGRVITERPVKTVIKSMNDSKAEPVPEVPVAKAVSTADRTSGSNDAGSFAAALVAARKQMTRKDSTADAGNVDRQGPRRHIQKRSSVASLRDYVPATLPVVHEDGQDARSVSSNSSSLKPPAASIGRAGSVQSRDSYATNSADTIYLDRCVLGPMDLTSPNRKGSQLVMRAVPARSQIVLEWQAERKTVLSLAFDALSAVQLPGPDCPYTFVLFQVRFGEAREVLLEMSEENLVHFQRFILILIAGAGANLDHLSRAAYEKLVEQHGW